MDIPRRYQAGLDEMADPKAWRWSERCRDRWFPDESRWQDFMDKWRSTKADIGDTMSLEVLVPSMYIRPCYKRMFHTVLAQAFAANGGKGVTITGHAGTGKTLCGIYLLARLLQLGQVVLYSPDECMLYLFYHDQVYFLGSSLDSLKLFSALPTPISPSHFIWTLIDISSPRESVPSLVKWPCFPVQTSPPDYVYPRIWKDQTWTLITGLPLWSEDELFRGLRYQYQFENFLGCWNKFCANRDNIDELASFPGICELLKEVGDQPSLEEVVALLLGAALDRVGYAARDVFRTLLHYGDTEPVQTHSHWKLDRLRPHSLTFPELQRAAFDLGKIQGIGDTTFDLLLALNPTLPDESKLFQSPTWDVDFVSDWIARKVIQEMTSADNNVVYQAIEAFRHCPKTRRLGERFLAPLIHRRIAEHTGTFWPLSHLIPDDDDPPHYVGQDPRVSRTVRLHQMHRETIRLQSLANLSSSLKQKAYYIVEDPAFPLFDSFTVELDHANKSAVLWVFQITTSRRNIGSPLGYQKIHEIITVVEGEFRDEPPLKKCKLVDDDLDTKPRTVEVRYVLVLPKLQSASQFGQVDVLQRQLPQGWSLNRGKHDHRGNVYALEVPLEV